jgi:CheY-like chemotaxis protein
MAKSRVEPGFEQDRSLPRRDPSACLTPDLSRVLVVGQSQINRIVVCKIVERSGLHPVSETPVTAVRILPLMFPGLVILDGGANNSDCDALIPGIMTLRKVAGKTLPATILLSNRNAGTERFSLAITAVVAKPFTTEQLQPVIDRLIGQARKQDAAGSSDLSES